MRKFLFYLMIVLGGAMTLRAQGISVYDFDDGTMQGWGTISAYGDQYGWYLEENNQSGHNSSLGCMASASHTAPLDNYLISPEGYYAGITFYACARDASCAAEHFGVAVSTVSTSFTIIQEWTMTAKVQGDWHEYSVDLSAYAGQVIWVAIRHFNCRQDCLLVDDITLTQSYPTYNFDDSTMQGWTCIDADGDGYCWGVGSETFDETGYGHNASTDCVASASYLPGTGELIPDNYLVSPAKGFYTGITFWACAHNADYAAEHFGVAVSTAGNTSASDFTTVQEWTMTAKGEGVKSIGRDGQTRDQGSWYEYTVDLSAYAGQEIWVAIRHFDCYDRYFLDVDDITLITGGAPSGTIESIYFEGYHAPALGQHPWSIEVKPGEPYSILEILWFVGDNVMDPNDVFETGFTYCLRVALEPDDGYNFVEDTPAYYDGDNSVHNSEKNLLTDDGILVVYTIEYSFTQSDATYDFEDGTMQGWTCINADGDGYCWDLNLDGIGCYGSRLGCMFSESYAPGPGALYPDNYLVCPDKGQYSEIVFHACGRHSYVFAEHFGVAVSTTGNTDASDFTTIQEWTIPIGEEWASYSADLNAYAGQEIWVAIRHFNCDDQFQLLVDDITLAEVSGVEEDMSNTVSVYPNPAKDKVMVTSDVTVNEYRIYDVTGTEIMNNKVNSNTFEVNVDNMAAGVYFIRIYSDSTIASRKFIKE